MMPTEFIWPVLMLLVMVGGFVWAIRQGAQTNAQQEASLATAATQLGAQFSNVQEGRNRFLRLNGNRWQLEIHILLPGSEGLSHRRGSSEHARIRYELSPAVAGLVVLSNHVGGALDDRVSAILDLLLRDLLGRAPAAPSTGLQQIALADGTRVFAHPPAAARFDAAALSALRELRATIQCEVIADPAGLTVVLARSPRSAEEVVSWVNAVLRVGSALDASP